MRNQRALLRTQGPFWGLRKPSRVLKEHVISQGTHGDLSGTNELRVPDQEVGESYQGLRDPYQRLREPCLGLRELLWELQERH